MKVLVLSLSVFFSLAAAGQNLVPNPSFEDVVDCPIALGSVDDCAYWSVYRETPDYLNSCSSNSLVSTPVNFFGYQSPSSGDAYISLCTYSVTELYREAAGVKLVTPMQIGTTYYLRLKAVRCENEQGYGTLATNGIGLKLSTIGYSATSPIGIDNNPALYSSDVIIDSADWTIIEGFFTADSAYEYLAVGNFFDDLSADTVRLSPPAGFAYYYVDDVCVSEDPNKCEIELGVQDHLPVDFLQPYPNPTTGIVVFGENQDIYGLQVFDLYGRMCYQEFVQGQVDLGFMPNGIYSILLSSNEKSYQYKLTINH